MRLVFLGLSLSSSWGNGHATTYRALLRALNARGHEVLFLEREQAWYASHRDLSAPGFCALRFYNRLEDLDHVARDLAQADAVVIGSYVPEGVGVIDRLRTGVKGLLCFYDIDTPVTMRARARGGSPYLLARQIPLFDLYLSFTGGPALRRLEAEYGAQRAHPLYCAVDPKLHRPTGAARRWDLGYLGTYSADRQHGLERLLTEPARRHPDLRFVVAGAQFPTEIVWPTNVDRIEHLPPAAHAEFYSSIGWALNVTRADMQRAGYSPSVRLFEASACGTPVVSDSWPGLDAFFRPGRDLLEAHDTSDVMAALAMAEPARTAIGAAGRRRTLARHTAMERAKELEAFVEAARSKSTRVSRAAVRASQGAAA